MSTSTSTSRDAARRDATASGGGDAGTLTPGCAVPLASLFSRSHFERYRAHGTRVDWLVLAAYTPFGLALACVRGALLALLLVVVAALPASFIFPTWLCALLQPLFGLSVCAHRLDESGARATLRRAACGVVVSNHRGPFDGLPFMRFFAPSVLLDASFFDSSFVARQFNKVVGAIPIHRRADSRDDDRRAIVERLHAARAASSPKLSASSSSSSSSSSGGSVSSTSSTWFTLPRRAFCLTFNEGWDTNGRRGLLLYQKFIFSLDLPIVPVALRVRALGFPLFECSVLGTSVATELFWLFFLPAWRYDLTFLPPTRRGDDESDADFARRVQRATAAELGIVATDYTWRDALALRSGKRAE